LTTPVLCDRRKVNQQIVELHCQARAIELIRRTVSAGASIAIFCLRWILQHDDVCCVVPGARKEY
jgi:aryl-alcohol dehydrogenase-like predicted oxidoreductase